MYNAFILMHRWLLYLLTNGLHNILGRNSCLLLDDGGGNHWLPQIGLRSPWPEINLYWPGQVWCNYPVIIATHHYSLTLGFSVRIPNPVIERTVTLTTASLHLLMLKPQVFYMGWVQKQPVIQQLPSVRHTDEAQQGWNSCLWLFHLCLLDDWGGDHWLP